MHDMSAHPRPEGTPRENAAIKHRLQCYLIHALTMPTMDSWYLLELDLWVFYNETAKARAKAKANALAQGQAPPPEMVRFSGSSPPCSWHD